MALKQAFSTADGVTDLLYVATHYNPNLYVNMVGFEPDMGEVLQPLDPGSLDSKFGAGSGYEHSDIYQSYYDVSNDSWKPNDGIVTADIKADITYQKEALRIYNAEMIIYTREYNIQKEVQWRKFMAQKLINACSV